MNVQIKRTLGSASTILVALATLTPSAEAIPAFARKYETSCSTCHLAIPQRNAFGEAFRKNGYKMPEGEDELVKRKKVSLGAPAWKEEFPNAIWPGDIPYTVPFSAYVHQRVVVEPSRDDNKVSFDAPHEFELLTGGSFGSDISFYGTWVFFEKGKNAPGLKQFWIQFEDLLGPDNAFNLRIGRHEPATTWGNRDNDRMTMEHVPLYDIRTNPNWRMRDQQAGIEVNGILGSSFEYAAGIVNGDKSTMAFKPLDTYFRAGFKLGGSNLDGVGGNFETLAQLNNWEDDSLSVGLYGYQGTNMLGAGDTAYQNDFHRIGVDIKVAYKRLLLRGGFVTGSDDNPAGDESEVDVDGWFLEADYVFYPWLIGVGRYGQTTVGSTDKETLTAAIVASLRANIRLSLEAYVEPHRDSDSLRWIKLNVMFGL